MNFHPELFAELLPYMGTGMLGIFIVMGVIIAITAILNRLTKKKSNSLAALCSTASQSFTIRRWRNKLEIYFIRRLRRPETYRAVSLQNYPKRRCLFG